MSIFETKNVLNALMKLGPELHKMTNIENYHFFNKIVSSRAIQNDGSYHAKITFIKKTTDNTKA